MSNYWWVLSGHADGPNIFDLVEERSLVGIGWLEPGDLRGLDHDAIAARVRESDPTLSPSAVGAQAGILRRFMNEVAVGDIVLTWISSEERILVGRVVGECEFNPKPDRRHLAYTRQVDWLRRDVTLAEYRAACEAIGKYGGLTELTVWKATPYAEAVDQLLGHSAVSVEDESGARSLPVGLERDLQAALVDNIGQLEPGLRLVARERPVEAGRIDILATDQQERLCVIELKAGRAQGDSIAQLLAYMATVDNPEGRGIRGILVAHEFAPRVRHAAQAVPNVGLLRYSFRFTFSTTD